MEKAALCESLCPDSGSVVPLPTTGGEGACMVREALESEEKLMPKKSQD